MRNFCKIWWKCRKYYEWRHKKVLIHLFLGAFFPTSPVILLFLTYFYDVTHDTFWISKFNLVWYNIYPFLSSNRMFVGPVKYLELPNSSISRKVWYWCLLECFRLFMGDCVISHMRIVLKKGDESYFTPFLPRHWFQPLPYSLNSKISEKAPIPNPCRTLKRQCLGKMKKNLGRSERKESRKWRKI